MRPVGQLLLARQSMDRTAAARTKLNKSLTSTSVGCVRWSSLPVESGSLRPERIRVVHLAVLFTDCRFGAKLDGPQVPRREQESSDSSDGSPQGAEMALYRFQFGSIQI